MTAELKTSLEIKFTSAQQKALEELKSGLLKIASNTPIPNHDPNHKNLKPSKVELVTRIDHEGNGLSIEIKAKTFCPTTRECFTYWDFNPETRQWEMPESLKQLKEPRKPIAFNLRRMNYSDDDLSST